MNQTTWIGEFLSQSVYRMDENTVKIEKCLQELNEEEIWQRPNQSSNSVGNLLLHLCGNITQYIIASLGETEDNRQRDEEFQATGGFSKSVLLEKLVSTVSKANEVIKNASQKNLLQTRSVQGFNFSGIGIVLHVVEHYSYHTGQIAFWIKLLKDKDLGFYDGVDLNKKNEF
ncbi:DinB family protein [Fulvivirgaceae bacterium BMA10]|uniref:DinB family protein n=1 Tax=Splendidivirga corallicola TaxID=3051826 RepID=A0ABT8KNR4_9BACT|nr:DinB family protein [Fulvivirgaceae bacterium BMA10]